MAHDKRLCRRSSRDSVTMDQNYHSHRAFKKAKARRKHQKAGRKAARRK